MENNVIPIFFSIDENYSKFLKIALKSIINHSSDENTYKIYVLHSGLKDEIKEDILSLKTDNFEINFVDVIEKISTIQNELFTRDYYSKTTYYRLFIPRMFPEYDKAIYVDSDIVLLGDIAELYNIDIGDNLVGAVPDESVQIVDEFIKYVENYLGVPHEHYFNAGVLLMNLKELRKFDFENKFLSLLKQIKFTVAQDQDYLNVICKDRVYFLSVAWDKMPFDNNSIAEEDIKLIHFNLSFKPWHYEGVLYEDHFHKVVRELELESFIKECKNDFTEEKKLADKLCSENLIKSTYELSCVPDTFVNLVKTGKIVY